MHERHRQGLAQPLADPVNRRVWLAAPPAQVAAREAICQDHRLERDQDVQHGERDFADVPADLAGGHSGLFSTASAPGQRVAEPAAADEREQCARRDRRSGVAEDATNRECNAEQHHQRCQRGLEPHDRPW
jgi:hypothetical protein